MPSINSMSHLDHFDRAIIHYLGYAKIANINEIATKTNMSWGATKSHLLKLRQMGYVTGKRTDGAIYWKLNI